MAKERRKGDDEKDGCEKELIELQGLWKHEPIGMTHPAVRLCDVSFEYVTRYLTLTFSSNWQQVSSS